MEAIAKARNQRGSPQKARLVVDLIRGKNVNEALAILRYTNKRAARMVEKCLRSAIANATELAERDNIAIDPDELWVKAAFVDQGPTKRRYRIRPAPHGRAYRERRHYCHITLLVSSEKREAQKATGEA
ncbi:50S ribosomal protein L22 [Pyrinomonas sp.]|uniref:50S ribosomal protein L22 n=1 Tax=Pyrinomonas sp. TaxID=2080306 RepID=UPI00331F6406